MTLRWWVFARRHVSDFTAASRSRAWICLHMIPLPLKTVWAMSPLPMFAARVSSWLSSVPLASAFAAVTLLLCLGLMVFVCLEIF